MSRAYFNRMAERWDSIVAERDEKRLNTMARDLDIAAGSVVLDVGAGTGIFTPFLLRQAGEEGQIVALDYAERMLMIARRKNFSGNIRYICADITFVPLRDKIIDITVCYSSFPHFHDKLAALKEINRVTKRGGRLLICHTSSRKQINAIHRKVPGLVEDIIPDEKDMMSLLSEAGFTDIKIEDNSKSYLCSSLKPG